MKNLLIIFVICTSCFGLGSCKPSLKHEVKVTYDSKIKAERQSGADAILSLDVELIKPYSKDSYLMTYHIAGSIHSRALSYKVLSEILIEERTDTSNPHTRIIELIPIQQGVGKAPNAVDKYDFDFKNEFVLKNASSLNSVTFICGDKRQTLTLPKTTK